MKMQFLYAATECGGVLQVGRGSACTSRRRASLAHTRSKK